MDEARHAVSETLALLHFHQMGRDRCRGRAGAETVRQCFDAMGQAMPKPALRPMLPADTPVLAAIFVASIEELTGDDYSEAQQEAWAAAADDEDAFGKRLASELTLVATLQNSPVGFASLKGADHIDMLYVHPERVGQRRRRDAVRRAGKTRGARGATASDRRRQRHRAGVLHQARLCRRRSATPSRVGDEWLANTTMQKTLAPAAPGAPSMSRERLYLFDTTLRDGAQTNGVDFTLHDKRIIARHARRSRHRLRRGRLSRRQPDRHRILRRRSRSSTCASSPLSA